MAFNISYIFQAQDQFSKVADAINSKVENLKGSMQNLSEKFDKIGSKMNSVGIGMSAALTAPIVAFSGLALKAAADQEKVNIQMENLIGSSEKALLLGNQLEKIKANAPVDVSNLDNAALRLLVMGTHVDKVSSTLENFAEISAGSGESMDNLINLFAQAQAGPEGMSRAITALGRKLPIMQELQNVFKEKFNLELSSKEIQQKISEGVVDISVLNEAFARMTREGGKFAGVMNKQLGTISGASQTLRNNFNRFVESVGFAIMGAVDLSGAVTFLTDKMKFLVDFVNEFVVKNPEVTKYIIIFAGIAAALGPVLIALGTFTRAIANIGPLITALTSPIGLVIVGVLALAALGIYLYNKFEPFRNLVNAIIDLFSVLITVLSPIGYALKFISSIVFDIIISKFEIISFVLGIVLNILSKIIEIFVSILRVGVSSITGIINIIKYLGEVISSIFGFIGSVISDSINSAFQSILDFTKPIIDFISSFGDKVSAIYGSISSAFSTVKGAVGGLFGVNASQDVINKNEIISEGANGEFRNKIDINLTGNTNAVSGVKVQTDNNSYLNLGNNMAMGGL